MLLGNLVAIISSAIIVVVVSLIKPDNYDWKGTREIAMVDDAETGAHYSLQIKVCCISHASVCSTLNYVRSRLHPSSRLGNQF